MLPEAAIDPLIDLLSTPMRGKKRPSDEALDGLRKDLGNGTLRQNAERLAAFLRHATDLGPRERGIVHLLGDARRAALARRRRAGALGFGDILRAARDGLRDRPDLADIVRADVDVLLVDEFQDTSTDAPERRLSARATKSACAARGPSLLGRRSACAAASPPSSAQMRENTATSAPRKP